MFNLILYFFLFFGIVSALYAVSTNTIVNAVFAMFGTFFSVTAVLVLAQAEFLAISHLMIYIGGIIVVMIFAIMLSSKSLLDESLPNHEISTAYKFTKRISGIACILLFIIIAKVILSQPDVAMSNAPKINSVQNIGVSLLSEYAFPLEIISLLLLVALMAASIITRKEKPNA